MDTIQALLLGVIRGIVEHPQEVELYVRRDTDDKGELHVINVKVNRSDIGVCIGKEGMTAEALRRVFGLLGHKQAGLRVYVHIDAPKLPKKHFYMD